MEKLEQHKGLVSGQFQMDRLAHPRLPSSGEQLSEPIGTGDLSKCHLACFAALVAGHRANWPITGIGTLRDWVVNNHVALFMCGAIVQPVSKMQRREASEVGARAEVDPILWARKLPI